MKTLGWIFLCIMMLWPTGVVALRWFDKMPRWNIGGVENKTSHKVGVLLSTAVVVYLWHRVYLLAPFSITFE